MAETLTIHLGEIKFGYKPKYLTLPKLKADFDLDIDTGFVDSDALMKKALETVAPKVFDTELKSRAALIDKALSDVDKDIDKKFNDFCKKNSIDPKSRKGLLPQQKKALDKFLLSIDDLINRLQAYLQKIVDGMNNVDSKKWFADAFNKCYPAVEKAIEKQAKTGNKRAIKRAAGGRAKIIILAVVAVAATALLIAGTVLTGGALLAAIFVIVGASLAIIAVAGKSIISLIKTRDKLRKSVSKLKSEAAEVKVAVDLASKMPTQKAVNEDILKRAGLSAKDYKQYAGDDKVSPDLVYKALAGKKRLFAQFDSHLKDVVALASQMHVGMNEAQTAIQGSYAKTNDIASDLAEAIKNGAPAKEVKKLIDQASAVKTEIQMAETKLAEQRADMKKLNDLIVECREISANFDKLGVVKSKISGWMIKMSQVETAFNDVDTVGKHLQTAGKGIDGIQKSKGDDWFTGMA